MPAVKKTGGKRTSPQPLWLGPESTAHNGGITFSLLCKYLVCKERFRLYVIEGLRPREQFNFKIAYGDMWHACEESLAANKDWVDSLNSYCAKTIQNHPMAVEEIRHWGNICKLQFPIYVDYWKKNKDVKDRKPLFQESTFSVEYKLPSGRKVILKGKWDAVDIIRNKLYLQENKTKGDFSPDQFQKQLMFDLQTMIYLVALLKVEKKVGLGGIRYNVVRRPLSGGKHSIRQHKATAKKPAETKKVFYGRLAERIMKESMEAYKNNLESYFFVRRTVEVTMGDIQNFCKTCLDPILEELCSWYAWVTDSLNKDIYNYTGTHYRPVHYRMPYGVYSPLLDGGSTEYDQLLDTGSRIGLEKVDTMFKELL